VPKGPSLKEIQEAEARTAAQREEHAAAARRAQFLAEQERLSHAQAQVVPGLPSSANWASSGSPATPTAASPAWNTKSQPAPITSTAKKTLAQIQKEEEARKQRQAAINAAAAAQVATPSPPASATKRYAELASKAPAATTAAAASAAPVASGAWTTVGASGKAKTPLAAPLGPRSTSGTIPVAPASVSKPRPTIATRTVTGGSVSQGSSNRAMEEFTKWAKLSLGRGLNSNINGKPHK
jgi:PERQ amino acid-rich with GYF domain-containing protein